MRAATRIASPALHLPWLKDRTLSPRSLLAEVVNRRRSTVGAILGAAISIGAGVAGAEARDVYSVSTGTSTLPTHNQLHAATERFLRSQPELPSRSPARVRGPIVVTPVFPATRIVSFYGAPQMGATVLGRNSPEAASDKLAAQSAPYVELGDRPVVGSFDLVSVFATAGGGPDGLYRTRQDDDVIAIYLEQARAIGARLMLDIQPGRSKFVKELRELREWIAQPDVDIGIDAEWNVGRRGIPGQTNGKVFAREVNRVSKEMQKIVAANDLPAKLLAVHQFRQGSVRARTKIRTRPGVQPFLNFDGIGSPGPKAAGYAALSRPTLPSGFSLFYSRDTPLMRPAQVLALEPQPDFLLYQ